MLVMHHQHTELSHAAVVGLQPRAHTGWSQAPRAEPGPEAATHQAHTKHR